MNFNEYTQLALRTKSPTYTRDHLMMGLFGEAGEIVDLIKKIVAHGHPVTPELLAKARAEIGDLLWYVAAGADEDLTDKHDSALYFPFGTIAGADLTKLAQAIRENIHATEVNANRDSYIDLLRTLAFTARRFNTTLEQCAIENIEKLRKRYPDGFSSEASQARVDVAQGVPFDEALTVVAKEFVLERTRRGFNDVPWYLYPTLGGSSHLAWTNKEEHAIRFKTADDALKALDGAERFTREAYVFRAKAVTK